MRPSFGSQAGATNFYAVWDHWLLDTLASWQKQSEANYAISADDDRGASPPPAAHDHFANGKQEHDGNIFAPHVVNAATDVPPRKRKAPDSNVDALTAHPIAT